MIKWYGKVYSTAMPSNFVGTVAFKIKDETVIGLKSDKPLKEFATQYDGYFDKTTGLWVVPVSTTREMGVLIKAFEREIDSYTLVACDDVSQKVVASLQSWIENRNQSSGSIPPNATDEIKQQLNRAKIRFVHQDTVGRILIKETFEVSDEESYDDPLNEDNIRLIKSLGFKKDGALWELRV